jgi:alpha-L-fucosidase
MIAHFYNQNMKKNHGKLDGLVFTKGNEDPRAVSTTHESFVPDKITDPGAWMSENAVGEWFYKPGTYYSTRMVIHQMIEAFAHGGNYTIDIPIRPSGELDEGGITTLKEIGQWMKVNGEAVYGSRGWSVVGEGKTKMPGGNLRKEQDVSFTSEDIRFTTRNGALYAFVMALPADNKVVIKTLADTGEHPIKKIRAVTLLGSKEKLDWKQTSDGLVVSYRTSTPDKNAFVLKIVGEYHHFDGR